MQRNPWINSAVKILRLHRGIDFILARWPLRKTTRQGLQYSIYSVASLIVANEVFGTDVYADAVRFAKPKNFVDLGANVGYFPLLVTNLTGSKSICGLVVEPNPSLLPAINSHIQINGLANVRIIQAAVTTAGQAGNIDFFINPSNIASSVSGEFNPLIVTGGGVQKILVPVVDINQAWMEHFPNESVVDLLKIDIEGAEMDFLQGNPEFMAKVAAVLIEWHKWICTFDQISALLRDYGFSLRYVAYEDIHAGTAYFERPVHEVSKV
jgi:FkbM family methyltransferase